MTSSINEQGHWSEWPTFQRRMLLVAVYLQYDHGFYGLRSLHLVSWNALSFVEQALHHTLALPVPLRLPTPLAQADKSYRPGHAIWFSRKPTFRPSL